MMKCLHALLQVVIIITMYPSFIQSDDLTPTAISIPKINNESKIEIKEIPAKETVPNSIKDLTAPSIKAIYTFHDLMKLSHQYGELIGFPETMQAILLQETNGGRVRKTSSKSRNRFESASYGVMQIQPDTARYIMVTILGQDEKKIPPEHELKLLLRNNDNFSIHLATLYFKHLYDMYIKSGNLSGVAWRKALLAYNVGPGTLKEYGMNFDPNDYINGIRDHLKILKEYNKTYQL